MGWSVNPPDYIPVEPIWDWEEEQKNVFERNYSYLSFGAMIEQGLRSRNLWLVISIVILTMIDLILSHRSESRSTKENCVEY
ncbi:hypothetical protein NPIL_546921 [Nephila pilipes]|uniref:Uncharacterized protein n=1 Tax=Nephila pilipes TaxID=299642 RepID=A0A8X6UNZ5_NEPPI|nr:hypothetical protein NPIL_546921 [Nephila pilipes]